MNKPHPTFGMNKMVLSLLMLSACSAESTLPSAMTMVEPSNPYQIVDLKPTSRSLVISAVGDHLIHGAVYKAAYDPTIDEYDFSNMYDAICPIIASSDIRYINFETLMAGEAYGYSGYPTFNGPSHGIDDLVECGFNWMALSSNHSFDKGEAAILDEYHYFDRFDHVITTGVHDSVEDQANMMVKTINGIDVGFLGYTYGLNGFSLPDDKPYLIDLIDQEKIQNDLNQLNQISDIQLVSIHWGSEYSHVPSDEQTTLAHDMVNWGADVIIGTHPHVIQPYEIIERDDGSQGVVFYSLGNFISAQDRPSTMLEAMAWIELHVDCDGFIHFDTVKAKPLINWIDHDYSDFEVLPFEYYDQDHVDTHELSLHGMDVSRTYFINLWNNVFSNNPIE